MMVIETPVLKKNKARSLRSWFFALLTILLTSIQANTEVRPANIIHPVTDEPPVSLTEARYEKLMKLYVNKIKLAFSETDDARSLAILNQFLPEFSQRSDGLKKEVQLLIKSMNPRQTEALYERLRQRAHTGELVALMFDERVTSRMNANPEIKYVMDALHAKSLEIQKSEREFIAAEK